MDSIEVFRTEEFVAWVRRLPDRMAQGKIVQRIARLELGLLGDVKPVGEKVWEIRIDYGPGYRLYFTRRRRRIVWLLCGGDKRSQKRDIQRAIAMAARLGIEE